MDNDEFHSLKQRVERLEVRLEFLIEQVTQLRNNGHAPQHIVSNSNATIEMNKAPIVMKQATNQKPESAVLFDTANKTPMDLERLIGRVWLPRIFIVVLLLGVMWGFNAAINAGLLNQPVRCLLGTLSTVILLFLGERQIRRGHNPLGQVLLGGALSIGVFTVFAAHVLYHLLSPALAFPLDLIIISGGVYLTYRHQSEALGILSSLGGYLVPFLIESHHSSTLFFVSYETVLSVAFLLFAIWFEFKFLLYVSIGLFQIAFLAYSGFAQSINRNILFGGLIVQHISFISYYCLQKVGKSWPRAIIYTTFVLLCAWSDSLFSLTQSTRLYLIFTISYFVVSVIFVMRKSNKALIPITCTIFALTLFLWKTPVVPFNTKNVVFLIEGALAIMLAIVLRDIVQFVIGSIVYGFSFLILLVHPIHHVLSPYTASWLVVMVTLYIFFHFARKWKNDKIDTMKRILYIAEATILLIFLTEMTLAITIQMSTDVRHISLSIVWLVYAILTILVGIYASHKLSRMAGIILLFLTLCKLILIDVPEISVPVRALLFIALGSVGVGISRLFYKKEFNR